MRLNSEPLKITMKTLLTLLFIMTTSALVNAQNGTAKTDKKVFNRATSVSISIEADPAIIWTLLTNASDFPRWNSTVISLEGEIKKGKKIKLKSTVDSTRTFKLKVKSMDPETKMVWKSGAAPFFRGVRTYTLTENKDGTTIFTMREKLGGMMFPMASKSIPPFDESFEQFAKDLKTEAESIQKAQ